MFTQEEYIWAWLWYLAGVAIFMLAFWFLSNKFTARALRYSTRFIVAVFFLVPWYTDDEKGLFSPAWLISSIEGFFQGPQAFWRAGAPLLIALFLSIFACVCFYLVMWMRNKKAEA